jgi:hypothetical protein
MTEIMTPDFRSESLTAMLRGVRRSALTKDQLFRVWRAAIKDDERLIDELIQKIYDDMVAFDRDRAEGVELIARRSAGARNALRCLLKEIGTFGGRNFFLRAS